MRESILDIPFPLGGLVVNQSVSGQPPGTTPSAVNVRGYEPSSGRDRGGQRSGLSKYIGIVLNAAPVRDINHLTVSSAYYAAYTGGQFCFLPNDASFALGVASSGGVLSAKADGGTQEMQASCWDASGKAYTASATPASSTLTLHKLSAAGVVLAGPVNFTGSANVQALGMATDGTYIYVLMRNAGVSGLPVYRFLCSDLSQVGGTFWYRSANTSVSSTALSNNMLAYATNTLAIGYGDGTLEMVNTVSLAVATALVAYAIFDVATDGTNYFYVAATDSAANGLLAKIGLDRTTVWTTATGNFSIVSCCFDPVNGVVAACYLVAGVYTVEKFNILTGASTATATPNATTWGTIRPNGTGGFVLWRSNAANNMMGLLSDLTANWAAASLSRVPSVKSVFSVNLLLGDASLAGTTFRVLFVTGTNLNRWTSGARTGLTQFPVNINPGPPVVFSAVYQSRVYYADGLKYLYYDAATDSVTTLTASSGSLPTDSYGNAGTLIAVWRQRLVVSGLRLDPSNWFMSAVGDFTNWNYAPSPSVETQAVAGNNAPGGSQTADVITSLVPYSDEILLFGQASSIYQLTGDPISGGRIDLVTDGVGMAYGRPWCRDGSGVLYFVSSRGSVYRFAPGGIPERISDPISDLLTGTVDLGTSIVRMAWDERQMGAHVFITPVGGPAAATHYFYDVRNQAWWQDVFANTSHNPLAVHELGGFAAADRVVLLGGQDGYIRFMDPTAADDDGTAINSYVLVGPIKDKSGMGLTLADLQGDLATGSGSVTYSILPGNDPQGALAAAARFTGTFVAGRNRSQAIRSFAHAHFVKLASANAVGSRWALEYLRTRARAADGSARQRIY